MNELEPRIHDEANGLDYILAGDYYIPAIELPEDDDRPIGKWGRMHRAYLEETNPLLLNHLILTGKLHSYLADLNEQVRDRCQLIIKQMADQGLEAAVAVGVGQSHKQHRKSSGGNHQERDNQRLTVSKPRQMRWRKNMNIKGRLAMLASLPLASDTLHTAGLSKAATPAVSFVIGANQSLRPLLFFGRTPSAIQFVQAGQNTGKNRLLLADHSCWWPV